MREGDSGKSGWLCLGPLPFPLARSANCEISQFALRARGNGRGPRQSHPLFPLSPSRMSTPAPAAPRSSWGDHVFRWLTQSAGVFVLSVAATLLVVLTYQA